ncbi:ArsR/SmtB family transcription factor [Streptomyces lasiicapitis]|uniref:ArsR/SmtB family transcription factor n=1 Tax=Streptomyces lasiicapitis TaxID=1923961 RepID=UPI00365FC5B6
MIEFTLTPLGAHRVRFAISPLEELLAALRIGLGLHGHPPRVARLDVDTMAGLPIAELLSVLGDPHYICEFLSPPTTGPGTTVEAQLAEVRRTPTAQVATELDTLNVETGGLQADPGRARDLLASQLEIAWRELIAPRWPVLRDILDADIGFRSGQLAVGGLDAAIDGLHPDVRMAERAGANAVVVRNPARARVPLDRRGLLLVPSVFTWPRTSVIAVAPWQPSIIYSARGIAGTSAARPDNTGLARVMGQTKARTLTALDEPMSTSALARLLGLAPSTVSSHLAALRAGGLLTTARRGHVVLYARTRLGDELAHG